MLFQTIKNAFWHHKMKKAIMVCRRTTIETNRTFIIILIYPVSFMIHKAKNLLYSTKKKVSGFCMNFDCFTSEKIFEHMNYSS